jgi:hypothetical protein
VLLEEDFILAVELRGTERLAIDAEATKRLSASSVAIAASLESGSSPYS